MNGIRYLFQAILNFYNGEISRGQSTWGDARGIVEVGGFVLRMIYWLNFCWKIVGVKGNFLWIGKPDNCNKWCSK